MCDKTVCSFNNKCVKLDSFLLINLRFNNDNNITSSIFLKCTIFDNASFDLIVGLPDIRKHNLLILFPDRFFARQVGELLRDPVYSGLATSIQRVVVWSVAVRRRVRRSTITQSCTVRHLICILILVQRRIT